VLHGLAAICHEAGNGGYIGSHCPKQSRASSLLGVFARARSLESFSTLPWLNREEPLFSTGRRVVMALVRRLFGSAFDEPYVCALYLEVVIATAPRW